MDDSPRPGCFTRCISIVIVVALLAPMVLGAVALGGGFAVRIAMPDVPTDQVLQVGFEVLASRVDESPAFDPVPVSPAEAPLCPGYDDIWEEPMLHALALMRGTDEGARLYDGLIEHNVCVQVSNLTYNSGYASYSVRGNRVREITITVDTDLVRGSRVDVLAALLVHEATHVDRAVNMTACWWDDTCVELANGVYLTEEVVAHGAEARWWIEAFGKDGKALAIQTAAGQNALAEVYLRGEEIFTAYVRGFRSDPREGADYRE